MHKLEDILMGGLGVGLALRLFREIDFDISHFCQDLDHVEASLNLTSNLEGPNDHRPASSGG